MSETAYVRRNIISQSTKDRKNYCSKSNYVGLTGKSKKFITNLPNLLYFHDHLFSIMSFPTIFLE